MTINNLESKIELQRFDTSIFKKNFYRIKGKDRESISEEFLKIKDGNIIVDAKINASDIDFANFLKELNFLKVCTQVKLEFIPHKAMNIEFSKITEIQDIDSNTALKLAKNFSFDRFSQDKRIVSQDRDKFYQEWIINSFASKDIILSTIGNNFCSFKVKGSTIDIDLLSVINKRHGYAKDMLASINNYAVERNIKKIKVITECENYPAFSAYISNGFKVAGFISCFHYINNKKSKIS